MMNYEYCDGMTHTIKQGDTLYSISRLHKVPLGILLRANPYVDVYNLQIGDTICIPVKNQPCRPGMNCMPNRPDRPIARPYNDDDDDDMYDRDDDDNDDDDMYDRDDDDDMYDMDNDRRGRNDDRYDRDDDDRRDRNDDRYDRDDRDNDRYDDNRDRWGNMGSIRMNTNEAGRSAGLGIRTDRTGNDDRQNYDMNNNMGSSNRRIRYVSQSGDTLQDLFDRSAGGEEIFWQMNSPDRMYLLAGVSYHIIEED